MGRAGGVFFFKQKTAYEIQDCLARSHFDGLEEEFRPAVKFIAGEHARIRVEVERIPANRNRDLCGPSLRRGSLLEVLSAHARDENPEPGLSPTFTFSGSGRA